MTRPGNGRGGVRWESAAQHCFDVTGNRRFTPDRTRGLGIWDGGGGIPVYNAGQACYTLDASGNIVPCSNIAETGIIYTRTEAAPQLNAPALTDEEGRLVMDYLASVPFRENHGGLFMGGLLVSSLLSGYLAFRPHCWINAPAESGKTELRNTLLELTGNFSLSFEGAESTPAGVRQRLCGNAVPVLFDESEGKDNRRNLSNIQGHLDNAGSATRGGVVLKGSVDGTGQSFPLRAGFMFFSVDNQLNRASDLTRFIVLTAWRNSPPAGASGNSAIGGLPPAKYLSSQSFAAANTGRPSLSSMSPLTVSPKYFWPSSHKPTRCSPSLASVSDPRGDE